MLFQGCYLFLLLLLYTNGLGVIGAIILSKYKPYYKNKSLYLFSVLTVGILLFIITISIIVTNFKTVNIVLLFLLYYLYYFNFSKKHYSYNKIIYNIVDRKVILKLFLELNIFISVVFVFYWLLYTNNKNLFIDIPNSDLYFYSRISSNFLNYGVETNAFNFSNLAHPAPYHYFDIWLNSGISLLNKNTLLNFIFITIPLLAGVCYFGFKSIISEIFNGNTFVIILLSVFGFLLSGVYINNLYQDNFIMNTANVFSRNVINYAKLFPFYLLLLWGVYFLKNKKNKLLFVTLGIVTVFFISSIIIVFVFCFLSFMYYMFKKNKEMILSSFVTLCVLFIVFCFYYYLSDKNELRLQQAQDLSVFLNIHKVKTGFNIFFKTNLQFICLYFFLVIILLLNLKKNILLFLSYKFEILNLILVYFIALFSWALFSHVFDSVQLFSNFIIPLVNILSIMFIAYNVKVMKSKNKKYVFFTLIGLVIFMNIKFTFTEIKPKNSYSENSLKEFENKILPKLKNTKIVYCKSSNFLNSVFVRSSDYGIIAPHLLLLDNFEYVSLSVFDAPTSLNLFEKEIDTKMLQSSIFYKYVVARSDVKYENIEQLKYDFILKNNIQLIVITNDVNLPINIKRLIVDSIIDNIAHEKYYLLKSK